MTTNRDTESIKAEPLTVRDVLLEGTFQVPWHQREYDWEEETVREFWEDIRDACWNGEEDYFVGTIVLTQGPGNSYEIQDGQQRLVTYSLLCEALRQAAEGHKDPRSPSHDNFVTRIIFDLKEDMPGRDRVSSAKVRIKTSLKNEVNYNLIARGEDLKPNGKLKLAWGLLKKRAEKLTADQRTTLLAYAWNKVKTVRIITNPERATQVFETINARGKPLDEVDLVRNHLYSHFGSDGDDRKDRVHQDLIALRDRCKTVVKMAEYVRCYMQYRYGFINERSLYKATKRNIAGMTAGMNVDQKREVIYKLVSDLCHPQNIKAYFVLDDADIESGLVTGFVSASGKNQLRRTMKDFIHELKPYNVTRPLMFAILVKYQEAQQTNQRTIARSGHNIAQCLNAFIMRTAMVSDKIAPSDVEQPIAKLACEVREELAQNSLKRCSEELRAADKAEIWHDQGFKELVKRRQFKRTPKTRQILSSIYRFEQPELPVASSKDLTLEHILPDSAAYLQGWPEFDEASHAWYHRRLGNLTLLPASKNKGQGTNASFEKKKPSLADSQIQENLRISQSADWSPKAIEHRQERLLKSICRIWQT